MPQSYQEHNGDNSTHTYTIAFGSGTTKYLKREHIKLYYGRDRVAGTQTNTLTLDTDYVYISDFVIKLIGSTLNTGVTVGDPYPLASGRKLTIERDTPQDSLLVPWADGSQLTKEALETSNLQVLFGQQEEADSGLLNSTEARAATTASNTATANVATLTANPIFSGNFGSTSIDLDDNAQIKLGTGDDASIYWDGTGHEVAHQLKITSAGPMELSTGSNKNIQFAPGGTVKTYISSSALTSSVNILPNADGTLDLGSSSKEWKDLYIDGTAHLDSVDIDAGAIDGTTIGGSSPAAGTFSNGTIATADINGGAIDGTTIGASSASTGAFTTLTTSSNATISGHATATSLQVNQTVSSHLIPHTHANYSLGMANVRWGNLYVNNLYSNGSTLHNSTTIGQSSGTTLTLNSEVGSNIIPTGTRDIGASDAKWNKVWTTDLDVTNGQLNTLGGMQSGTASVLADSTALAATTTEINAICDGKTVQTTISDTDASYPTSGAVVDYVAAQIAPLGGLEVIANEDSFPTIPASGVVISIADAGGIVVNGSGVSTTARTAGNGSDNVTINGFPSSLYSTTLTDNMGLMVSSTGSSNTYTYHKLLGKEDDIKQLSDDINDFNARYRVAASAPSSSLDDGDLWFDTANDKMKVYNATGSSWDVVTSVGDFNINTISSSGNTGGGSATFNGTAYRFVLSNPPTSAQQLIVSVNGVIQKPNAGSSQPSEGFAISGNDIIFAAAPPSGADYFITTQGSQVSVGTPSDNTVSTAKLQNLAVTGDKIATNLDLADNKKIRFGTGNDLELYHDASHSRIKDTGTGYLIINTDTGVLIKNGADDEGIAYFTPNGAVELMYDNSKKLETTSTGISTQGNCIITGHFYGPDNSELRLGSADDFKLYHDGTNNYIKSANDNQDILIQSSKDLYLATGDGSTGIHTFLYAADNAGVELRYDNVKKAETTSSGFAITGVLSSNQTSGQAISIGDTAQINLGAGDDLKIYHSGSHSHVLQNGTGNLYLDAIGASVNLRSGDNAGGVHNSVVCNMNAGVELYYDNVKKAQTYANGLEIIGNLYMQSGGQYLSDDVKIRMGNSNDLELHHDASHSHLKNSTGTMYYASAQHHFYDVAYSELQAKFVENGSVELYYNNSSKIKTTDSGCTVYGSVSESSDVALKKDITPLSDSLTKVKQLKGYSYKFKDTNIEAIGFTAQDVEKIYPALVEGEEGEKGLNYGGLIAPLVEAIKELSTKIETLETKVAALEAK